MVDRYFRGQGTVYLSARDVDGQPTGGFRYLGNCSELLIRTETQDLTHKESYTGSGLTDLVIEIEQKASLMMKLESFSKENLALGLFGTMTSISGTTVTAEEHTAVKGKSIALDNINITTWTSLTPSGGTPVHVQDTDYTVDLKTGMVQILSSGGITDGATVKANYTFGDTEKVSSFTVPNTEYWLRFNGLNTAESNKPVVVDCYKVRLKPQSELKAISDDLASLDIEGAILYDIQRTDSETDGRFFRVRQSG